MSMSCITVRNLTMAYGTFTLMRDLNFTVNRGDIFIIMGGSGCGKSTLLRHLIGLKDPAEGEIWYGDESFTRAEPQRREQMLRRFGILYQTGALWSSMTLAENVGLPLAAFTTLGAVEIRQLASLKLGLVGLKGFEDYYPSQISGGMQKRAGLARAMALDPEILFFRRTLGGTRSDQLAFARSAHSRIARLPGRYGSGRDARAGKHLHDRQRQHLSRCREPHNNGTGPSPRTARPLG